MKMIAKEEQDYRDFPEINSISERIINEKGNYIPLFKFLHKLIPENSFSVNDYNNIKKTFLEDE